MARSDQILTANRLRDGEVVYWAQGQWVADLARGEILREKTAADAALAAADESVRSRIVVSPYLFDVRIENGHIRPVKERELIRAAGPTVRHDLGKQARHVSL